MTSKTLYLTMASALVLATACGGDDHDEVSAAEDACEHMIGGPSEAVTAIDDFMGDGPDIGEEHTRFDVTLAGDPGQRTGFVDLPIAETGEFTVFMSADVQLAVFDDAGSELAIEATNRNVAECAEVSVGHTFDFEVGTYLVSLGPTDQDVVQFVVVHEGEHAHDHE